MRERGREREQKERKKKEGEREGERERKMERERKGEGKKGGREMVVLQYYEQFCFRAQDYSDYVATNSMTVTSLQSSGVAGDAFNKLILCFETTFGAEKHITIKSDTVSDDATFVTASHCV